MTEPSVIAVTLGDVAGIGPEVVVRACCDERLPKSCRPIVVGHPEVLRRAVALVGCDRWLYRCPDHHSAYGWH